jgi:hypothetical protein
MSDEGIIAPGRLGFPSGHSIDVHTVRNGQVYYQVWHPGEETKAFFADLIRKPIAEFVAQVREHKGARIEGPHG